MSSSLAAGAGAGGRYLGTTSIIFQGCSDWNYCGSVWNEGGASWWEIYIAGSRPGVSTFIYYLYYTAPCSPLLSETQPFPGVKVEYKHELINSHIYSLLEMHF
jgi:hypothetical protein